MSWWAWVLIIWLIPVQILFAACWTRKLRHRRREGGN